MKEIIDKKISSDIEKLHDYLKNLFSQNSDVVFRKFEAYNKICLIVYIDGMADKNLINDFVIQTILDSNRNFINLNENLEKVLTVSDMKTCSDLEKVVNLILSGETSLFVDGKSEAYIIASRCWPNRGINEPSGESVIRGSKDGFTETIRFNTALIRRRIRDTRLKIESMSLGVRSKTDIAIAYIDDIVNVDILKNDYDEVFLTKTIEA